MKLSHSSEVPVRKLTDYLSIEIIKQNQVVPPCHKSLSKALSQTEVYKHLSVREFCPTKVQPHYRFIQRLKAGLDVPFVLLTYSPGNNMGNLHFAWTFESTGSTETVFQKSLPVIDTLKPYCHSIIQELCAKHSCQSMAVLQAKFILHS